MTFDVLIFQKGPDDGLDTRFYMTASTGDEDELSDRLKFNEERGLSLVDRFNNLPTKLFDKIYELTSEYVGPKDEFMRRLHALTYD